MNIILPLPVNKMIKILHIMYETDFFQYNNIFS